MRPGKKENSNSRQKTIDIFHEQENNVSFKVRPRLDLARISTPIARYQF